MHFEEDVFSRKERKLQKKRASSTDRSKFKKTDRSKYFDQVKKEIADRAGGKDRLEGRVIKLSSFGVEVDVEGCCYQCSLRGLLKKEMGVEKNLVVVGDLVLFTPSIASQEGVISEVLPRKTVLSRADNLSRRKEQLIAANVDQVLISVSVVEPALKIPLIDRYLIAASKGGLDPILVINKMDLLQRKWGLVEREKELFASLLEVYPKLNIPVVAVSTETGEGIEQLLLWMQGKTSVFAGQSGVGKTSLINRICGLTRKVRDIVEKTQKGSHTTTHAELLPLPSGGWCVDTPGIKSFGVWSLTSQEVRGYFEDIHFLSMDCLFSDCTHLHEKECAVQKAVEGGALPLFRYHSYCSLMESTLQTHQKR